jgi:hypothetical protein
MSDRTVRRLLNARDELGKGETPERRAEFEAAQKAALGPEKYAQEVQTLTELGIHPYGPRRS